MGTSSSHEEPKADEARGNIGRGKGQQHSEANKWDQNHVHPKKERNAKHVKTPGQHAERSIASNGMNGVPNSLNATETRRESGEAQSELPQPGYMRDHSNSFANVRTSSSPSADGFSSQRSSEHSYDPRKNSVSDLPPIGSSRSSRSSSSSARDSQKSNSVVSSSGGEGMRTSALAPVPENGQLPMRNYKALRTGTNIQNESQYHRYRSVSMEQLTGVYNTEGALSRQPQANTPLKRFDCKRRKKTASSYEINNSYRECTRSLTDSRITSMSANNLDESRTEGDNRNFTRVRKCQNVGGCEHCESMDDLRNSVYEQRLQMQDFSKSLESVLSKQDEIDESIMDLTAHKSNFQPSY